VLADRSPALICEPWTARTGRSHSLLSRGGGSTSRYRWIDLRSIYLCAEFSAESKPEAGISERPTAGRSVGVKLRNNDCGEEENWKALCPK